jgi:acyl-CoA thioesterase FadM
MNLYIRLIWTLLRSLWLPKISIEDTFERTFRVLPNDIDINLHMNNGRYATVADLMIVEFFARTGFLKVLLKNKWRPMVGGTIITYRKQLHLGQKYRLRYRWTGSDDHWNYMYFEFLTMDGRLCATGYSKGAAIAHDGLVHNDRSFAEMALERGTRALPDAVLHWKESERQLMAS